MIIPLIDLLEKAAGLKLVIKANIYTVLVQKKIDGKDEHNFNVYCIFTFL